MQLFCKDATTFKKKVQKKNLPIKTFKKMPSKGLYLWQFVFFFTPAPIAQNSPELKTHIRNVVQDTSVYYSVAGPLHLSSQRRGGFIMLAYSRTYACMEG